MVELALHHFLVNTSVQGRLICAKPDHFFRNRVAVALRLDLTHEVGSSRMERSQFGRGQIPALYRSSFCFLVTDTRSTLSSSSFNFSVKCCLWS